MGWGSGFVDGRMVGYDVGGKCTDSSCETSISLGLANICGTSHIASATEWGCATYFCDEHLSQFVHGCLGIMEGTEDHTFVADEDDAETCGYDNCGYTAAEHGVRERELVPSVE